VGPCHCSGDSARQFFKKDNESLQVKANSLNTPVVLVLDENLKNIAYRTRAGRIDFILFKPLKIKEVQKTLQYISGTRPYKENTF
jgi:hypothetical protein